MQDTSQGKERRMPEQGQEEGAVNGTDHTTEKTKDEDHAREGAPACADAAPAGAQAPAADAADGAHTTQPAAAEEEAGALCAATEEQGAGAEERAAAEPAEGGEAPQAEPAASQEETPAEGEQGSGAGAARPFGMRTGESMTFAQRMSGAGYLAGRRYDAVKNELLRYRHPKTGKGVRAKLSKTGENFSFGRKTLAMLRVSGATLRLFLALDPGKFGEGKYHHKNMSGTARYARCPMMLRLTSDRQVRHAQELIALVMAECGLEEDPNFVPCDQAAAFGKPRRQKRVYVRVPAPAGVKGQKARAQKEKEGSVAAEIAASSPVREGDIPPTAIKARLPRRAAVFDRFGVKIGRLRRGVWYDEEKEEQGTFREQGEGVLYYPKGKTEALAYLDGNGNLLTGRHKHVATLRHSRLPLVAVLLFLCAALIVLAILLGALAVPDSSEPYAPTIFLTTEDGEHWEDSKELDVFLNDEFEGSVVKPGMRGAYRFKFENANDDAVAFSLLFSEVNEYGIGMKYRLVRDGASISGEEYRTAAELGREDLTLEARSTALFELQWYWEHNDEVDTAAGEASATYTLIIELTASVRE